MAHGNEKYIRVYSGNEKCHARPGKTGSTRTYSRCRTKATNNANGRLLCDEHFESWKKKYKNRLHEYRQLDEKIVHKECMKAYGGLGSEWDTGIAGHLDNI